MNNPRINSRFFAAQIQTPFAVQVLTLVIVIAIWELIGRTGILFDELFPPMLDILQSLWGFLTTPLLLPHLKASLYEVGGALVLAMITAIPLGILSAARRDTLFDQFTRVISLVGVSIPVFWLGLIGILVFYAGLGWAPPPGRLSADIVPPPFVTGFLVLDGLLAGRIDVVTDALRHLVLPAIVLSSYGLGIITRMMRGSMLEVLAEDYIRTATAKGLSNRAVLLRHAARNGLIPVLTVIGLSFGGLLSGTVVTESVFAWPGLGLYAFRSATSFDSPAIMGVGVVIAMIYVLVNLVVDVLYGFADPRIRMA